MGFRNDLDRTCVERSEHNPQRRNESEQEMLRAWLD
jgi:hypothetical protein